METAETATFTCVWFVNVSDCNNAAFKSSGKTGSLGHPIMTPPNDCWLNQLRLQRVRTFGPKELCSPRGSECSTMTQGSGFIISDEREGQKCSFDSTEVFLVYTVT